MAAQDFNNETNVNKRIRMNITMSIEVNKDESGKEYQDLVKSVTKEAMTRIDAELTGTNSKNKTIRNQATHTEITRLDKSDYKNSENNKLNENSALNTNTVVETEAMKQIRLRLKLKKKSKQKPEDVTIDTTSVNVNSPNTNWSRENVLHETKKTKVSKRKLNCTTDDKDKNKINETEAMKIINRSLEVKKKLDQNQNAKTVTGAIHSFPSTSGSCEDVLPEKKKAKVSKRKLNCTSNDNDKNKINETEAMKRIRQSLGLKKKNDSNQNAKTTTGAILNFPSTSGSCENVIPETEMAKVSKRKTNCTTDDKETNKINETEAMKRIRQSLELKKKLVHNQNAKTTTGAILNSPSTSGSCENVLPETEKAKVSKRKTDGTYDEDKGKMKETEAMEIERQYLELKKKLEQIQNESARATTSSNSSTIKPSNISGTCESVLTETRNSRGTKSKWITNDKNKNKTKETEAMKRVRQSLELKKKSKQNQNEVANATSSFTSESVFPGTINTASRLGIKRKIANVDIHKPHAETEKIKRIKLTKVPDQIKNYASTSTSTASEITKSYSTTRGAPRNSTTFNIEYDNVTKPNLIPNECYEMTEDESEIEMSDAMSETNTGSVEDNRIESRISSTSSYYLARSVGGPEDTAAASSGRRTRLKTAWERKLWTK